MTSVVIFQLKAKHLQKVTRGGDSIANGGRVGAKRGCSLREGELGNVEKMSGILASKAKFPLQVLLSDLYIAQGHANVSLLGKDSPETRSIQPAASGSV